MDHGGLLLAYLVPGKDVDWLSDRTEKKWEKTNVASWLEHASEMSEQFTPLTIMSSRCSTPSTTFYSHPTTKILLHRLMHSTSIIRCDRNFIPFVRLGIASVWHNALRSFIQDVAITTRNQ